MSIHECAEPGDTFDLGRKIGRALSGGECIALDGPLGAGKTVLAKGIAAGLAVEETVTSPTYTIISQYIGRNPFIHVDLYRIDSEEEFQQLALEDLRDNASVTVIEWPERASSSLPDDCHRVELEIRSDGSRSISVPDSLLPSAGGTK